jgi:hypothetical protein
MASADTSLRSPIEPMAFTRAEFMRGAVAAWVWFLVLHSAMFSIWIGIYVVVAWSVTLPWSLLALFLGSPLAYLLGKALRSQRLIVVHLTAFTLLGLTLGAATATAALLVGWGFPPGQASDYTVMAVAVVACAGAAVPLGWWWTVRRARATDHSKSTKRIDPDAAFEDAL